MGALHFLQKRDECFTEDQLRIEVVQTVDQQRIAGPIGVHVEVAAAGNSLDSATPRFNI